jgi:porin
MAIADRARIIAGGLVACVALLAPRRAAADDPLQGALLAGDARYMMADSGVLLTSDITHFYFGNVEGGLRRHFEYGGHGDYVLNVDGGKLGTFEGQFLKVRAEHRFGESVSDDTGALLPATLQTELPARDREALYLTNVLLTQAFSESFAVFAGKLDTLDGDVNAFAHGRGKSQFSNMGFVANPIVLRTIPYSTLGAGFVVLYEGQPLFTYTLLNATDTTRTDGLDELFEDGAVMTAEARVPTNFFERPGHQLVGGTWSGRNFVALGQDPRIILPEAPIAEQSDSWSLYWNADQYIVVDEVDPLRGWGLFARAGVGDDDTNPLETFFSIGVGGHSPLRNRESDTFGVGWYHAATSDEIGSIIETAFGPIGDGQGVELFYNIAAMPWLTITPDMQVIVPAREDADTALLFGVRANMSL